MLLRGAEETKRKLEKVKSIACFVPAIGFFFLLALFCAWIFEHS
jgi:hypothetical protein